MILFKYGSAILGILVGLLLTPPVSAENPRVLVQTTLGKFEVELNGAFRRGQGCRRWRWCAQGALCRFRWNRHGRRFRLGLKLGWSRSRLGEKRIFLLWFRFFHKEEYVWMKNYESVHHEQTLFLSQQY